MTAPPEFRVDPVRVRVPATSANLGPGFDSFGLALTLADEVVVQARPGPLAVEVSGEGAATVARDEAHLVVSALRATFDRLGGQPSGLAVRCANAVPHGRGLGSSSAAIVAGVVAARALALDGRDRLDDAALLALAAELEGHPDNVAPCLAGGLTLAWTEPAGARAIRLDVHPDIWPVVFVPAGELATARARGLLPATVPHADAAANAARAGLLVEALTRRPDLLLVATEDRLHQEQRRPAMPDSLTLMHDLRAAGVPATVSGAGPSVLALASPTTAAAAAGQAGPGWRVERLDVDACGACVLEG